jgi:ketosteroid isomerase-like protein
LPGVTPQERSELVRRYFEIVHRDPSGTGELYAPNVVLHYSGSHRLSGEHRGPAAILNLFTQSATAFQGTQRLEVHDVVAGDQHAVALLQATAKRHGEPVMWQRVVVFHAESGRITEQWIIDGDQALVDELIGV